MKKLILIACLLVTVAGVSFYGGYCKARRQAPLPAYHEDANGDWSESMPLADITNRWYLELIEGSSGVRGFVLEEFPRRTTVCDAGGTGIILHDFDSDSHFDALAFAFRLDSGRRSFIDNDLDGQWDSRSAGKKREIRIGTNWHEVIKTNRPPRQLVRTDAGLRRFRFTNSSYEVVED